MTSQSSKHQRDLPYSPRAALDGLHMSWQCTSHHSYMRCQWQMDVQSRIKQDCIHGSLASLLFNTILMKLNSLERVFQQAQDYTDKHLHPVPFYTRLQIAESENSLQSRGETNEVVQSADRCLCALAASCGLHLHSCSCFPCLAGSILAMSTKGFKNAKMQSQMFAHYVKFRLLISAFNRTLNKKNSQESYSRVYYEATNCYMYLCKSHTCPA